MWPTHCKITLIIIIITNYLFAYWIVIGLSCGLWKILYGRLYFNRYLHYNRTLSTKLNYKKHKLILTSSEISLFFFLFKQILLHIGCAVCMLTFFSSSKRYMTDVQFYSLTQCIWLYLIMITVLSLVLDCPMTLQSSRSLDTLSDLKLQCLEAELEGARHEAQGACQREEDLKGECERLREELRELQSNQRQRVSDMHMLKDIWTRHCQNGVLTKIKLLGKRFNGILDWILKCHYTTKKRFYIKIKFLNVCVILKCSTGCFKKNLVKKYVYKLLNSLKLKINCQGSMVETSNK